jgi:hypothetical protein
MLRDPDPAARRRHAPGVLVCLVALAFPSVRAGTCAGTPRTLVLALDGVPHRVVVLARDKGAFAGWPAPIPLVAPFPSVTNVSFTAMLSHHGVAPSAGYELQHFDRARNEVTGASPLRYRENSNAWRDAFDSVSRSLGSELATYTIPVRTWGKELARAEEALLSMPGDLVMAHVGSSDALQHIKGDRATLALFRRLDEWIERLKARHERELGRPLRVVLLSDHGNSERKIRGIRGVYGRLRAAGLDVRDHLHARDDVVAPTFGLVGYGALFLDPDRAEQAARAVAAHPRVELAAWRAAPNELRVVSAEGTATVRWRDRAGERSYAYEPSGNDPLRLERARAALASRGRFDAEGYAADGDWFDETALEPYPDPLHRLVTGLTGDHVVNHATVLFSVSPGWSWGLKSARLGSWLRGGRIEGTHGGLDYDSTLGFFMTDDRALAARHAVRAEDALDDLEAERLRACRDDEHAVQASGGRPASSPGAAAHP